MLKAMLRRTFKMGVSPQALIARVDFLRRLGRLPKAHIQSPESIENIFFSFPYHSVGDLILSLSLLDHIHERWPKAQIDVVVGSSMGALVAAIPYVRHTYQLPPSTSNRFYPTSYKEISNANRLFQREIAGTTYDLAMAPRWDSFDSFYAGYLAYLTGAPIRCGYSGSSDGGSPAVDRFYTTAAVGGMGEHESLRYTRLLSRCALEEPNAVDETILQRPIRSLQQIAEHRKTTNEAMASPTPGRYAIFSPGATHPQRMWPISNFCEVGRALYNEYGLKVIVIGSLTDASLCEDLSSKIGPNAFSLAGKTDSLQMFDLINGADLFLGNDSGPAHIAGGLGINTVVISPFPHSCTIEHPNSPQRFKPIGPKVQVLRPTASMEPCYPTCLQDSAHCILQVTREEVLTRIRTTFHEKHYICA